MEACYCKYSTKPSFPPLPTTLQNSAPFSVRSYPPSVNSLFGFLSSLLLSHNLLIFPLTGTEGGPSHLHRFLGLIGQAANRCSRLELTLTLSSLPSTIYFYHILVWCMCTCCMYVQFLNSVSVRALRRCLVHALHLTFARTFPFALHVVGTAGYAVLYVDVSSVIAAGGSPRGGQGLTYHPLRSARGIFANNSPVRPSSTIRSSIIPLGTIPLLALSARSDHRPMTTAQISLDSVIAFKSLGHRPQNVAPPPPGFQPHWPLPSSENTESGLKQVQIMMSWLSVNLPAK